MYVEKHHVGTSVLLKYLARSAKRFPRIFPHDDNARLDVIWVYICVCARSFEDFVATPKRRSLLRALMSPGLADPTNRLTEKAIVT